MDSDMKVWQEGPSISEPRYAHGCGRIFRDGKSNKFSIIIAGGIHLYGYPLDLVEILDEGETTWHSGKVRFFTQGPFKYYMTL
jgi:hypothetical protein